MSPRKQTLLFPEMDKKIDMLKPVNVASVPQRSPFRYPGGKTWFVPTFRRWCSTMENKPKILVEPFAGGGIISLTALFENIVQKTVMVEIDEDIAAVWETVVKGDAEWLANRISGFEMSKEALIHQLGKPSASQRERAFQTILKNRTFHGGILAEGAGFLKYGEKGKGIHSRWYPKTIADRFLNIMRIAARIDFRCDDGLKVMKEYANNRDAIFFIDPPYTAGGKKAGKRLYRHCLIEHERLFELCGTLRGDFLMTYDNAAEVKNLAAKREFDMRLIPMTNTHHAAMEELVIGKDLSWMDGFPLVHEPKSNYGPRKSMRIFQSPTRAVKKQPRRKTG